MPRQAGLSETYEEKGLTKERDGVYIDAQGRRVWDQDHFLGKNRKNSEEDKEESTKPDTPVVEKKQKIDFARQVGVSMAAEGDIRNVGFLCEVCGYRSKDSADYLDHLTTPQHLQKAGVSRVRKHATKEDVRRVLTKKRTRDVYDFDSRVKQLRQEEERKAEEKRESKRQKKEAKRQQEAEEAEQFEGIPPEMAEAMGLPASFGSAKK